ncbi:VOC family protein [Dactylosporangium vinaceum]|uniref:VOC family protein n=1 Tax=Dactylosporangium vinaceum TaxID=53362 RepID=A0ABV5M2V2_9ACTN|nr:VOC family protein [Dactylosporangium vinaceum]UAB96351.1 VOC family protein [Dactylosporangium vinaceum]
MPALHHLALTVRDVGASAAFYDPFLTQLGYQRSGGIESPLVYLGDGPEILVYVAEGDGVSRARHQHGAPGLQHLAFKVGDAAAVDAAHRAAAGAGGAVVHPPRFYPEYADGYYAVFVEDLDGSRFEVAYIPSN